jgi:NADPH-dependent F420 reductase
MSKIGFIGGTGPEGKGLGLRMAMAGHEVILGSRNIDRANTAVEDIKKLVNEKLLIRGESNNQTASESDIVFITVPYEGHKNTLIDLESELSGKIVVDTVVPIRFIKGNFEPITVTEGSAAEEAAASLPNSSIIGAFHNVSAVALIEPATLIDCDVLVTGNDLQAKTEVMKLAEDINGIRAVDGGRIENSKQVEDLTVLLLTINKIYKKHSMIKIVGL